MASIRPQFDFRHLIPAYGDGQAHTEARDRINALRPELFNEFERVMVEICDAIGDYTVSDTIPGSPNTLGGALRYTHDVLKTDIDTLYDIKFDKAGGTITGNTTMQENLTVEYNLSVMLDVTIDQDLSVGGDLSISGNVSANGDAEIHGSFSVNTNLMYADDTNNIVGINCIPSFGTMQVNGNIVPYSDGQSLGSISDTLRWSLHATTITGTSLHINTNLICADSGTIGIGCTDPVHTVDVNGNLRLRTGSVLYFGGNDATHLAYISSYDSSPWRITDVVINNNVDDGTMFRVVNNVGSALCAAWQSSNNAPVVGVAANGRFISGRVYNAVWNDIAETVPSDGNTQPGDLIMVDIAHDSFRVTKYDGIHIEAFIGIQSENPGYVIGWNNDYRYPVFIALKGMVPVTLPNASKRFNVGDRLILIGSSIEAITRTTNYCDPLRTRILGTVIEIQENNVKLYLD